MSTKRLLGGLARAIGASGGDAALIREANIKFDARAYEDAAQALESIVPSRRTVPVNLKLAESYASAENYERAYEVLSTIEDVDSLGANREWYEYLNKMICRRIDEATKLKERAHPVPSMSLEQLKLATGAGYFSIILRNSFVETAEVTDEAILFKEIVDNLKLDDELLGDYIERWNKHDARLIANSALKLVGSLDAPLTHYELAVANFNNGHPIAALKELHSLASTKISKLAVYSDFKTEVLEELVRLDIDAAEMLAPHLLEISEIRSERTAGLNPVSLLTKADLVTEMKQLSLLSNSNLAQLIQLAADARDFRLILDLADDPNVFDRLNETSLKDLARAEIELLGGVREQTFESINLKLDARKAKTLSLRDLLNDLGYSQLAFEQSMKDMSSGNSDWKWWDRTERVAVTQGVPDVAMETAVVAAALADQTHPHFRAGIVAEQMGNPKLALYEYIESGALDGGQTIARLRTGLLQWKVFQDRQECLRTLAPFWEKFDYDNFLARELGLTGRDNEDGIGDEPSEKSALRTTVDSEGLSFLSKARKRIMHTSDPVKSEAQEVKVSFRELRIAIESQDWDQSLRILWSMALSMVEFRADVFHGLGYVYAAKGDDNLAFECFNASQQIPSQFLYETAKAGKRQLKVFRYLELFERLPILKNVWLWESHFGKKLDGNPLAMFSEAISRPECEEAIHVWVANQGAEIPLVVRQDPNTVVTPRESFGYWLALACAEYLTNNASFSFEYMHREGQVSVNTWHGTPLKALGKDDKDSPYDYGNVARNFIHSTHLFMPNDFTSEIMTKRYQVSNLIGLGVAETVGYPRNDMLSPTPENTQNRVVLRTRLGIPDDGKPVVLYAPTWRGSSKSKKFDGAKLVSDLDRLQASSSWHLIFRGHPLTQEILSDSILDVHAPSSDISTYELMNMADVVITDYSSLGVDFLATGRPVIYYTYDAEEYAEERGLNMKVEEFPGLVVYSITDLLNTLEQYVDGELFKQPDWDELQRRYVPQDDGNVSERLISKMLESQGVNTAPSVGKKKVLIHSTFSKIDESENLKRLLEDLDYSKLDVTLVFDHFEVGLDKTLASVIDSLPQEVSVYPRKGALVAKPEEQLVVKRLYSAGDQILNDFQRSRYSNALLREKRRLFADNDFDIVIEWQPESIFWTAFMALGFRNSRRVLVLNRDVNPKWAQQQCNLLTSAQFWSEYDVIVTPSPAGIDEAVTEIHSAMLLTGDSPLPVERKNGSDGHLDFYAFGGVRDSIDLAKVDQALSILNSDHDRQIRLTVVGAGAAMQRLRRYPQPDLQYLTIEETNMPFTHEIVHADAIVNLSDGNSHTVASYWAGLQGLPVVDLSMLSSDDPEIIAQALKAAMSDAHASTPEFTETSTLSDLIQYVTGVEK
ncbi:CDP-glycerol glycerophosphotransferase (TagB/SpsB family) [Arcanobacterium wilhelmae]|uniref:CDP-glycerol glycerophosphotransferase (TagB/SpsB family) n=1 Tax=Arcanobacterium wilhelmae TaxID=1803177 RepID=A0ABT9NC17_9ACTO|nr:CDP-glycerol glycerophosphotransferase family protein [Arcanobacterium wilhelmae]MDP9801227.1 CDP-glycerol glycerophosphotransferase (TagB/SpsB family) [Arcanobacterium wilhelmae]WFN90576.1 CDP-glycerol glycerophosphotransferase family protein [Arcanobacterium wilhelmae]